MFSLFSKRKNKPAPLTVSTAPPTSERPAFFDYYVRGAVLSDVGCCRKVNEDRGLFLAPENEATITHKNVMLIVADGMGGHAAGEVASSLAVEVISRAYTERDSAIEQALENAFHQANRTIYQAATKNKAQQGMGTTCTALVVIAKTIYFAHAGDSRAYLYKDKRITRITEDHTYVQELVNNGDITSEQAETHPQRNILTNAMGTKPSLRVDTGKCHVSFDENDRLMLCSDGLYDYLTDDEIAAVMDKESLQDVADHFINEAKKRGGKDNITVVLAELSAVTKETILKSTRETELPKLTRDADIPEGLNITES